MCVGVMGSLKAMHFFIYSDELRLHWFDGSASAGSPGRSQPQCGLGDLIENNPFLSLPLLLSATFASLERALIGTAERRLKDRGRAREREMRERTKRQQ